MATIRDVARESGVSTATVSYVLNNGPRPVAAETRTRILEVMRRMNFHPSAMARGMAGQQIYTVGVLFGYVESVVISNPYAAAVLEGILTAATDEKYNVTIFTTRWENAEKSAPIFRDGRTDGVLVVAPLTTRDVISGLSALGIPTVVASGISEETSVPYVDVDNEQGARLATEYLLSLGHHRIAHMGGDEDHSDVPIRRGAFLGAMAKAGIRVPSEYVPNGTYNWERAREIIRHLLTLPKRPTAVFAGNDVLAQQFLMIAQQLRLRVPEDLSLVGFDDIPTTRLINPPLTTIRQPLMEIGELATHLLIRQIEKRISTSRLGEAMPETTESPGHLLEPELIIRGSTAPPL